jgi:hypothetical protein
MPRRLAPTSAVVLAALVFGLGAASCGGGGQSEEEAAADRQAQVRWQTGLARWRADMLGALNGISLLLSTAASVDLLRSGDVRTTARLDGFEQRLAACHVTIGRLGEAPESLAAARREALRACRSLESGAQLVHDGVASWRIGRGDASISRATETLGDGQRGVERVRLALRAGTAK